jgi:hypothetical protein
MLLMTLSSSAFFVCSCHMSRDQASPSHKTTG